jgi:hypothetical protein
MSSGRRAQNCSVIKWPRPPRFSQPCTERARHANENCCSIKGTKTLLLLGHTLRLLIPRQLPLSPMRVLAIWIEYALYVAVLPLHDRPRCDTGCDRSSSGKQNHRPKTHALPALFDGILFLEPFMGLVQRIAILDVVSGDHVGSQSRCTHDFELRAVLRADCHRKCHPTATAGRRQRRAVKCCTALALSLRAGRVQQIARRQFDFALDLHHEARIEQSFIQCC